MIRLFTTSIFILLSSVFLSSTYANSFGVLKYKKGNVYKYQNNQKIPLMVNDQLSENDQVVTLKKTIAKIHLYDGSKITIGPSSKIVLLKRNSAKPSLIHVFKGMIDASIKKRSKNQYNFHITTKTASIGVRGTSFKLIYNDENQISSILTYSGAVDFKKQNSTSYIDELPPENMHDSSYHNNFKEDLTSYKTRRVTPGKFSSTNTNNDQATSPLMISKKQYAVLVKKNRVENLNTNKSKRDPPSNNKVKPDGYLDFQTGIYVPPPENAKFDSATQNYEMPKDFGSIDNSDGDYIPPDGIKLHPVEGFILDLSSRVKEYSKVKLVKLKRSMASLNSKIKKTLKNVKKLTRVNSLIEASLYYDTNIHEDFYGELKNITHNPSQVLDFNFFISHKTVDSQKWKIAPYYYFESLFHLRQNETTINKEDKAKNRGGINLSNHYRIFHRKAFHILDTSYTVTHKDLRNNDHYYFYTEDFDLTFGEGINLFKYLTTKILFTFKRFETHTDVKGDIYKLLFKNELDLLGKDSIVFDIMVQKTVIDQNSNARFLQLTLGHIRKNIFRKTDFLYSLSFRHLEGGITQYKSGSSRLFWSNFEISRRKGDYLRFNIFYRYFRQFNNRKNEYTFEKHASGIKTSFTF